MRLADFALVRVLRHPPKKLTNEVMMILLMLSVVESLVVLLLITLTLQVITLWYRPPEILMGQREYTAAVDIWSIGCIYAELLQGKALFAGLCEIDQLFQIFQIMGTPNAQMWPGFEELPYYQETLFPSWNTVR